MPPFTWVGDGFRCALPILRNCGSIHVIASEAKQSIYLRVETMDCFAALAMTGDIANIPSPSRGALRPSCAYRFALKARGRRECRVPAGTRGLVCKCARESAHTSIQVQPEQPGIPCAMVLRLIPRSPWRRIPFASIAGGLKVLAKPGWISQNLRRLDASNGRQDHTALPSAFNAVRRRAALAHGPKPALRKPACAPGAVAATAPRTQRP